MGSGFRSFKYIFIGFIKLIRLPNLFMIVITQYLVAIFLVGKDHDVLIYLRDPDLLLITFSTAIIAAAGYIINDYYDIKIDYLNRPERVVIGRFLKRREALFVHLLLNMIGIICGVIVSWKIGILDIFAGFLLWSYSNYFKRKPFIGNVIIAFLTGLSILMIGLYYMINVKLVLIYSIYAFGVNLIREIIKDIEDWQGDATFGCKTLPIIWGLPKTRKFLYFLIIVFTIMLFLLSFPLHMKILNIYFLLLLFPIIVFWRKLSIADTRREFRFLSIYCKLFMLGGILSMLFFRL